MINEVKLLSALENKSKVGFQIQYIDPVSLNRSSSGNFSVHLLW